MIDLNRFLKPGTPVTDDPRRIPIKPVPEATAPTLIVKNGRLFDGSGTPAAVATLVIQGNKIKEIVKTDAAAWPDEALVIDASGKTVMPGLIDLHTHLSYVDFSAMDPHAFSEADGTLRGVEKCRYFIECGITSIRDVGSYGAIPFRLKEWIARKRIPGPRVFAAGDLITSLCGHGTEGGALSSDMPGHGCLRTASGVDDWREAVREQFHKGADLIKLGSNYSREEVKAAIEEAHALGLKATVDAETFHIEWAVEAGVDMVEHPLPRTDETIALMAEKGTEAIPTIVPYILIMNLMGGYFGSTSRRFTLTKETCLDVMRRMKDAGIKMGVGTDLVSDWYQYLPEAYITELKQFTVVGYSVPEALVAATKTSAEILAMGDKLGTLEAGKLADVILIDGEPDKNLDHLANVHMVIRDGTVVVDNGQLSIPRHTPAPMPKPAEKQ